MPDEELEQGTTDETAETTDQVDDKQQDTGSGVEGDQTQTDAKAAVEPNEFEKLIPPNELPVELKPHWKRMHGAYSKALAKTQGLEEKANIVDRFYNDTEFARNTLAQWALNNGYQLTPAGQGQASQAQTIQQQGQKAPPQMIEAVKAQLPQELAWMADSIAGAHWAANQLTIAPILQQQQESQRQNRSTEYDRLAADLTETSPGWEEHEDTMSELLSFLQGPNMSHPRYGSKLALLHNMATGNAAAVRETTRRMTQAVKNRPSSQNGRVSKPVNVTDRVRKAGSDREAWAAAAEHALAEVTNRGVKLED